MTLFTQDNALDFKGSEYAKLFAGSGASAFQSPLWLDSFYRHLAPYRGADKLVISLRDQVGELVGLVPMIRRRKSGLTLIEATDLGVSDYSAPVLSDAAREMLRGDAQVQASFVKAIGAHDILRIQPVLPDHIDDWQSLLNSGPEAAGFSAHAVGLYPPFDRWRGNNLDRKLSGMVARKGKRWKKQHKVELEHLQDPSSIKLAIKNLARLRQDRFEGDPIQEPAVADFYASVASSYHCGGVSIAAVDASASANTTVAAAETWVLSSDGSVAGILFGLTHLGAFHYLLIGADYDTHGRHSPGLQMYDWIIEDWMARGGTSFDFTIGDEPFKQQFGTTARPMSRFLRAGSLKGRMAMALLGNKLRRANG
ncbi:MAG: GNAT family N-acetyltransferase [Rhizobiaceae bacterium]